MLDIVQWQLIFAVSVMAHCKNIGGGSGDDERCPPRLTEQEKAKEPKKTVTKKKHKCGDIEAESSNSGHRRRAC